MSKQRPESLHLKIEPVIGRADQVIKRAHRELPSHEGLATAAAGVAKAANDAQAVSRRLRRLFGIHRLPILFLTLALLALLGWVYVRWFHVSTLTVALPERDAVGLRNRLENSRRVRFRLLETLGSRVSLEKLQNGDVDLAFVQGGISIPSDLPRLETPRGETVLFFARQPIVDFKEIRVVLTSSKGQGSHTVAQDFFEQWNNGNVTYRHDWRKLTAEESYQLPGDVDAVFVIKDLANENTYRGVARLNAAGFQLQTPQLGGRRFLLNYLNESVISAGYLQINPQVPAEPVATYSVKNYLVARKGLTPRLLAEAAHLLDSEMEAARLAGSEPTFQEAKSVVEAVESFLGILVYIGVGFIALLGWEVTTYRKRFNELNTIVSLISMHQSNKDVLGEHDPHRLKSNLLYLSLCSDLLGLISVITGYYSQENPSLLYNKLLEIIHQRSSSLKLNIQLKILHANISNLPEDFAIEALPTLPSPQDGD